MKREKRERENTHVVDLAYAGTPKQTRTKKKIGIKACIGYIAITFLFIEFKENTHALCHNTFKTFKYTRQHQRAHDSLIDFGFILSIFTSFDDNACCSTI